MRKIALAAFGLAIITLFLSCADNSDLEFPSKEEMRERYSSSSVAENSSSSSETEVSWSFSSSSSVRSSSSLELVSSSSSVQSSSSLEPVSSSSSVQSSSSSELASSSSFAQSSSSSEQSSSSPVAISSSSSVKSSSSAQIECAGIIFNPANRFCYDSKVYDRCGGEEYIPASHICVDGVATPAKCGGESYNPLTQFCSGTTTYGKCGGTVEYNPATESCCGNGKYTIATESCCGNGKYTIATESCCGNTKYTLASQFCSGTTAYGKCGGTEYNPAIEGCCGSNRYIHESHFCYNNSKIGNFCGTRTEMFDPDLYECTTGDKIYLKTPVSYEGESYEAVLIGTQTWMARNLNYNADNSRCYGDDTGGDSQGNCAIYGRLYDWATAMALASSCNSNSCYYSQISAKHKGICPSGWHIPSFAEWAALRTTVSSFTAGTKLKSASGWNTGIGYIAGTDDYGFSALPGGGYLSSDGSFYYVYDHDIGHTGHWWSSGEYSSDYAHYWYIENKYEYLQFSILPQGCSDKSGLFSVRCVQD